MASANKRSDFHTCDGRIDADKAFGFVLQRLETMTPEEFRAIRNTPMPPIGVQGAKSNKTKTRETKKSAPEAPH